MNADETWPNYRGSDKDGVRTIIDHMGFSDDVKYGKTKIFIRSPRTIFALEKARAKKIPPMVTFLQRVRNPPLKRKH
jgi:myosin-1